MLILGRFEGEKFLIGEDIIVTVSAVQGNKVCLDFKAPPAIKIYREEIYYKIKEDALPDVSESVKV